MVFIAADLVGKLPTAGALASGRTGGGGLEGRAILERELRDDEEPLGVLFGLAQGCDFGGGALKGDLGLKGVADLWRRAWSRALC